MVIFTFYRVFHFALQAFWRNFWLSVVTISVIVLAFISINVLIVINIVTDSSVKLVKDNIDVSIYFKSDTDTAVIDEVQSKLTALPEVERVTYISKEQALEEFRKKHRNDLLILESLEELDDNPLNPTLRIKAKNTDGYASILEFVNNSKYNSAISDKNFDDHREYIDRINTITANVNKFGIGVSVVFTIIALLIVFNTIKLAIYSQREEIAIMKLVGANNFFISSPYIIEGVLYALIGCALSVAIIFPILDFLQPSIDSYFNGTAANLHRYFAENFFSIFGLELAGLVVLNILASAIAVRRYLKI